MSAEEARVFIEDEKSTTLLFGMRALIQAHTDAGNMASQQILQKAGFKKEGTIRKSVFSRGEWRDRVLFSILREEWKEPKILTKTK